MARLEDSGQSWNLGLFATLVANFIAPFFALVLMVAALLAVLYGSSLMGGQAWISASNSGAVPQIFEMVALSGRRCFDNLVVSPNAACVESAHQEELASEVLVLRFDQSDTPGATLGGAAVDLAPFKALLREGGDASGFGVVNNRVVHVVAQPRTDRGLVVIADVTDTLVRRLSSAAAVEVELYNAETDQLVHHTWRDVDGNLSSPLSAAPPSDARTAQIAFSRPYGGYTSRGQGSDQVFSRGDRSISAFSRSFEPGGVSGVPPVRSFLYVPYAVMLFYTNWSILAFVVVTIVVFGFTMFRIRAVTARFIRPVVALSERVREMRGRFGGADAAHASVNELSKTEEIAELSYAISRLEQQLIETERLQRRARIQERLESLGRLTGGIAHDFNNLLNIVLANCSFLLEDVEDEEVLQSVRDIEGAAQSAADMTRGLLAFSSGRASPSSGRNVASEVVSTVELIGRTLGPEVDLQVDVSEVAATAMPGSQLQQILMNLILNARDASRADGVSIHVSLHPSDVVPSHRSDTVAEDWLKLVVRDNGVGMDGDTVARVFDPFFSLKGMDKSASTGLGLSVVYGLVEGVGGAIEVDSEPEVGTAFSVFLPRVSIERATAVAPLSPGPLEGLRVALVEDDDGVRRSVSTLLGRLGLDVLAFSSGEAVMAWMDESADTGVDLIVTDIRMPQMDGYEVAAHCRSVYPNVPIMFMTGFDPDALDRLMPENSALVMKPMGAEEFLTGASGLVRVVNGSVVSLVAAAS